MKSLIHIFIFITISISAQEFTVEKITGKVMSLRGTSEDWEIVKVGQNFSHQDLIQTDKNASIKLRYNDSRFLIKSDAAILLNDIKEVSINDLILALTLDEIRNVPRIKRNNLAKNTAVYGSKLNSGKNIKNSENLLGQKKLNGAKLLSNSGYIESSIIVAKEVFRKYPVMGENFADRLYFADLLYKLNLYQEAIDEYNRIEKLDITEMQEKILAERNQTASLKLLENN